VTTTLKKSIQIAANEVEMPKDKKKTKRKET